MCYCMMPGVKEQAERPWRERGRNPEKRCERACVCRVMYIVLCCVFVCCCGMRVVCVFLRQLLRVVCDHRFLFQ